jgi:recombination protein RecA
MGVEIGAVQKSGAWYSMDGDRIGQGRDNAREFLLQNPDRMKQLEAKILEAHNVVRVDQHKPAEEQAPAKASNGAAKPPARSKRAARPN